MLKVKEGDLVVINYKHDRWANDDCAGKVEEVRIVDYIEDEGFSLLGGDWWHISKYFAKVDEV